MDLALQFNNNSCVLSDYHISYTDIVDPEVSRQHINPQIVHSAGTILHNTSVLKLHTDVCMYTDAVSAVSSESIASYNTQLSLKSLAGFSATVCHRWCFGESALTPVFY